MDGARAYVPIYLFHSTLPAMHCDNGEDEKECKANRYDEPFCRHETEGYLVPVHDFTKCAVVDKSDYDLRGRENKYCKSQDVALFQTNCTDPLKVVRDQCH